MVSVLGATNAEARVGGEKWGQVLKTNQQLLKDMLEAAKKMSPEEKAEVRKKMGLGEEVK
jgi:hypothetical protein